MIRSNRVGLALAIAAALSVPPAMGAFAQSTGCSKTAQAEGNRQNTAQAETNPQKLAQAENSSSGGGMYGRQYSQAEGNRQNTAQAEGPRDSNPARLAAGTIPGANPCP